MDPMGLSDVSVQCPDLLPRSRILAEQQDVFKHFEQHHAGQFKDDHSLVSAFENVMDNAPHGLLDLLLKQEIIQSG